MSYKHKTLFQIHNLLSINRAENKEYMFLTFSLFLKRLQHNLSQCDSLVLVYSTSNLGSVSLQILWGR